MLNLLLANQMPEICVYTKKTIYVWFENIASLFFGFVLFLFYKKVTFNTDSW